MNADRIAQAAAIIATNTGINVLPSPAPTFRECAEVIKELVGHLHINKLAYRRDAAAITASTSKACRLYERIRRES